MKTTIDIPGPLYKRAKIRAVEAGLSLKALVVGALQRELEAPLPSEAPSRSAWSRRKLRPRFREMWESGALGGGTDSTAAISEERSGR